MSGSRSLTATDGSEYELIEATMSESSRGRWFLQEYARRNRSADTEMLLGAIERLEGVVTTEKSHAAKTDQVDRMRVDLMDMAQAIARTKVEIAAISAPDADQSRLGIASTALDAIVLATERATSDILDAAEHVQEAAWTLRESGSDTAICDELDHMATQVYTACSFQDLTAQRTARIIHTLRYLEERLGVMMAIWGDEIAAPPEGRRPGTDLAPVDLCQSDVDRFIGLDGLETPAATPEPRTELPEVAGLNDDIVFLDPAQDGDDAEARAAAAAEAMTAMMMAAVTEAPEEVPAQEDMNSTEDMSSLEFSAALDAPVSGDFGLTDDLADTLVFKHLETEFMEPRYLPPEAPPEATAEVMEAAPQRKPRRKKTDVAAAFANIDKMTSEEKAVLFS